MTRLKLLAAVLFLLTFSSSLLGQTLNGGADFVSRYIWRGSDINSTPNLQPSLEFGYEGLALGLWGSYTLSNQTFPTDEVDLYLGYGFDTEAGEFSILVTDYYFPNAGTKLGNFEDDGAGAHTIEIGAGYNGPISIYVGYNAYNDPGKNIYFEVGYSTELKGVGIDFTLGGTPGSKDNAGYYGTDKFAFINFAITGSKSIKISEDFELPLFTSLIINPEAEMAHLVAGFGLAF